jgi:hypothetical protein
MNIRVLKLINNEDVLGEIESESETEFVLVNPVGIAVVRGKDGQPNVGFAPWPIHAEPKSGQTFSIQKKNVLYSYEPAEDFVNNYNQIFGTGIILPKTQSIITG